MVDTRTYSALLFIFLRGLCLFPSQLKALPPRTQRATSRYKARICSIKGRKNWFTWEIDVIVIRTQIRINFFILWILSSRQCSALLDVSLGFESYVSDFELKHSMSIASGGPVERQSNNRSPKAVLAESIFDIDHPAGGFERRLNFRSEQKKISLMTHLINKFCPLVGTVLDFVRERDWLPKLAC